MEELIYYCLIGRGSVLVGETTTPRPESVGEKGPPAKLYCPHCEMLVVPLASSAAGEVSGDIHRTDARSENQGRSRGGGTNAGGSQGGDLSDQGATQWRQDPSEVGAQHLAG